MLHRDKIATYDIFKGLQENSDGNGTGYSKCHG